MSYYVTIGQKQDGVYHTDTECRQLTRDPLEATEDKIERMGLRECKVCSGDATPNDNGNREHYQIALHAGKSNQ